MTPGRTRWVFTVFALFSCGVAANAMLLQNGPTSTAAGKFAIEEAARKAAMERLRRLAADASISQPQPEPARQQPALTALTHVDRALSRRAASGVIPQPEHRAEPRPQKIAIVPPEAAVRLARLKPDAATPDSLPDAPDAEGLPETIRAVQRELHMRGYGPLTADGVPGLLTRAAIMAFEHDAKAPLTGEATEALLKRLLLGTGGGHAVEPGAGKARSAQAEIVIRTVQQSLAALGYQSGKIDGRIGDETERAIREFEMDHGLEPSGRISAPLFARLARAVSTGKATKLN
jgi:peptidoglycan hydrolase-like protein with peptidoglycan-binding domain